MIHFGTDYTAAPQTRDAIFHGSPIDCRAVLFPAPSPAARLLSRWSSLLAPVGFAPLTRQRPLAGVQGPHRDPQEETVWSKACRRRPGAWSVDALRNAALACSRATAVVRRRLHQRTVGSNLVPKSRTGSLLLSDAKLDVLRDLNRQRVLQDRPGRHCQRILEHAESLRAELARRSAGFDVFFQAVNKRTGAFAPRSTGASSASSRRLSDVTARRSRSRVLHGRVRLGETPCRVAGLRRHLATIGSIYAIKRCRSDQQKEVHRADHPFRGESVLP